MSLKDNSKHIIKCPYCGAEYLPAEIYYPDKFLGQEKNIERDTLGSIVYYEGVDSNPVETYICDHCDKQFKVVADIKFTVHEDNCNNLDSDYYTLKPVKLFLDEN